MEVDHHQQQAPANPPLSFRDLITGNYTHASNGVNGPLQDDEAISDDDEAPEELENDERCPLI